MANIEYHDSTHTYYLDGFVIPSVTQVLQGAGLSDLSKVNKKILEIACERGSAVHLTTELHDKKTLDVDSIDPELLGYYKAYLKFLEDYQPEIIAIELMVWSEKRRYAGTLDRIFKIGDKTVLLDIKTGSYMPSYSVQTSAYELALEESHGIKVDERACLILEPTGSYKYKIHNSSTDASCFISALNVVNWKNNNGVK